MREGTTDVCAPPDERARWGEGRAIKTYRGQAGLKGVIDVHPAKRNAPHSCKHDHRQNNVQKRSTEGKQKRKTWNIEAP